MTERKRIKARARRKDFIKKKNMIDRQLMQLRKGQRKGLSVSFPMSRKFKYVTV